ncbi:MAG: glucose 1-dehydrogenase [Burkholderiaceae bacterium]|nr:glucose 1-dehydrogenase [Burkholderiaceae bacterium]
MGRLNDKVAIITGSGKGIGRASALLFASEGARVVVAELDQTIGAQTAADVTRAGGQAIFAPTDVTDEASVKNMVALTLKTYGRIDILYNNAGLSSARDGTVVDAEAEEFWRAIKLNLFGTWLCCRHVIPAMQATGGGSIVNAGSVVALMGLKGLDAYTASKGGVIALTRSMAVEFAPAKIRVNAIAPTTTLTERVIELNKSREPGKQDRNLLGPADPLDIAQAALYLASDESRKVTGQVLAVDSGRTIS